MRIATYSSFVLAAIVLFAWPTSGHDECQYWRSWTQISAESGKRFLGVQINFGGDRAVLVLWRVWQRYPKSPQPTSERDYVPLFHYPNQSPDLATLDVDAAMGVPDCYRISGYHFDDPDHPERRGFVYDRFTYGAPAKNKRLGVFFFSYSEVCIGTPQWAILVLLAIAPSMAIVARQIRWKRWKAQSAFDVGMTCENRRFNVQSVARCARSYFPVCGRCFCTISTGVLFPFCFAQRTNAEKGDRSNIDVRRGRLDDGRRQQPQLPATPPCQPSRMVGPSRKVRDTA